METWEAIDSVRVIRKFQDRPLEPEHLERILNAGRRTSSSKNEQVWTFMVVTDRARLRELTKVGHYADHLAGAAVAVALVAPDQSTPHGRSILWDLGRAAQSMVLAAWEAGDRQRAGDGPQPPGGGRAAGPARGPTMRLAPLVRLPRRSVQAHRSQQG